MADPNNLPYVSEFTAAIRHPEYEKGQESTFHVVLTQWQPNVLGEMKPSTVGPIQPETAERHGFNLDKIIGEVTAAAMRTAELHRARADKAEADLAVTQATNAELMAGIKKAEDEKIAAVRAAGDLAVALDDANKREAALVARVDELTAETEGPANPMLNKLTFGLLGN